MKLLVLLLSTLLALSSTAPQDFDKREEQRNVSSLSPDLEDKITTNISVFTSRRFLRSIIGSPPTQSFTDQGTLKWKAFDKDHFGSPPNGSVSIYNNYAKRTEFVCRCGCHSGYYSPSEGFQCHIHSDDSKINASDFEILVNEDDFEILEWKDGSSGSVPQNSVRTCAAEEIYVIKNMYGLGMVVPKRKKFRPWRYGLFPHVYLSDYLHRNYQVLTINKDVESNFMTDIRYHTDDAKIVSYPPETMRTSVVTNYDCNQATKSVTLTKTIQEQKRWDVGGSITLGARTEFKAGIPCLAEGKVEVSTAITVQASGGQTNTEGISHSVTVSHPVPPNHSCTVRMVGHKYTTDILFTARFRRTYKNGKTTWTTISGTYDSIQMKLLVLLLPTLLPLSSAAPQDFDKRDEQRNVSLLSATLQNHPEIAAEASVQKDVPNLASVSMAMQEESVQTSPIVSEDDAILEWVTWRNYLPNDAVSIYNDNTRRVDYICKYNCEAGFYTPSLGPYCNYPLKKKEYQGSPFQILVNKNNFEILEWKDSSKGSPILNAVRTCPGEEVYVGKNKYGLGKVVTQDKVFYLPWKGSEKSYKDYQVLTINENVVSQQIDNVVYNTDKSEIVHYPPEIMRETAITNYECSLVVKTDSLSKTYQVEQRWDNTYSVRFGVKTSIRAGIPFIIQAGIKISTDVTLQFNSEGSVVESITDTVSVQISAPPNRTCTATMMRSKYKLNIPYRARLRRTYGNGEVHTVIITGTYNSVQVGEVRAVVHRCETVPNAKSCP